MVVAPRLRATLRHARAVIAFVAAAPCLASPAAAAFVPTVAPIVVDGDFDDWQTVLVNPLNTIRDGDGSRLGCLGATDLDCPVQSTGRDLRLFAWTYDSIYLYVYVVRQGNASNTETFWHYIDINANQLMESGEPVLRIRFHGSSGSTLNDVYRYQQVDPGGDPLVDAMGNADGYTLPGSLASGAIWSEAEPNGGSADGRAFEERVPWTVLGGGAGIPVHFHVASSNSPSPGNVASQIDDNLGRQGGNRTGYELVEVSPDHFATTSGGSAMRYMHEITNTGILPARFSVMLRSSASLSVSVYTDPSRSGVGDQLMGFDRVGDSDFTDAGDSIGAGFDTNADSFPDTPVLAPGESFPIVVAVWTRAGQMDITDVTTVTAFLASNPAVSDSALDTTDIGPIAVRFDQARATLPGQAVGYAVQVCNNVGADTLDITVTSTTGSAVTLGSDADCDGVAEMLLATDADGDGTWDTVSAGDTDGDGVPDTGLLATGRCACFIVGLTPGPLTPLGSVDIATVVATSSNSAATGSAELRTTVAGPIDVSPDYLQADGTNKVSGPGRPVFFPHIVQNNGSVTDTMDLVATNSLGWRVTIWSDPDGDGSIADGQRITRSDALAPFGGSQSFVVQVDIPADAAFGSQSTTIVTARSRSNPGQMDSAQDDVKVSMLATYSDALFTQATTFFAPCDTIYVEGYGLQQPRPNDTDPYDLEYFDGADRLARRHGLFIPDPQGEATDQHALQGGDVAGPWHIDLVQGNDVVASIEVTVEAQGEIISLSTDRGRYPLTGADVTFTTTLRNANVAALFDSSVLELVVLDPTGTLYLVPGLPSTFAPWSGAEVTRSVSVPPLAPGEVFTDTFTALSVDFPTQGVYSMQARWRASCGTALTTGTSFVAVGSTAEDCTNGTDDDGDGLIDCADPECGADPACHEADCGNGSDDDGDTLIDCEDPDCVRAPECPEIACSDGLDNDLDGLIDCLDPDCAADPACIESQCDDGLDNDGDGLVDCGDPDCADAPACLPETDCNNRQDDDGDTLVDCDDTDCALDRNCRNLDPDGDTVPNDEDCAPLDPGAHHLPLEVPGLDVTKANAYSTIALLTWTDMSLQAGTATVYDVISGLLTELVDDRGFLDGDGDGDAAGCIRRGLGTTTTMDARRASASDGYYYIVRAVNACGAGSWGSDSFGVERMPANGPCGP